MGCIGGESPFTDVEIEARSSGSEVTQPRSGKSARVSDSPAPGPALSSHPAGLEPLGNS